jgi:hypothetical protein
LLRKQRRIGGNPILLSANRNVYYREEDLLLEELAVFLAADCFFPPDDPPDPLPLLLVEVEDDLPEPGLLLLPEPELLLLPEPSEDLP